MTTEIFGKPIITVAPGISYAFYTRNIDHCPVESWLGLHIFKTE